MRARIAVIVAASAAVAGCGGGGTATSSTPTACLDGPEAFVDALHDAPEEVLIDDTTPIGDCLPREQESSKIADVGQVLVATATRLNQRALRQPMGEGTFRLGYLVGSVQARAEQTGGIHEDLALRVEREALYVPADRALPGGFQQRYEQGVAAGRASVG